MITHRAATRADGADVIVVGAGLAGLTAAADLAAQGRDVIVLEAGSRLGGRIDSRPTPGGDVAELGAQVVHGADNPVLGLSGDSATTGELGSGAMLADLVTPDAVVRGLAADDDFLPPPALWAALHSMRRAVGPVMAPRLALGTALSMMKLTSASVQGLLGWLEQITGADAQEVSLERICTEPVFAFRSGAEVTFPRGLDALLAPLAERVSVHTGNVVHHIGRDAQGVRVTYLTGSGIEASLVAAACVVTVPPPVVASGRLVIEDLASDQWEAARRLTLVPGFAAYVPLTEPAAQDSFRCDLAHGCGFLTWVAGRAHVSVVAKGQAANRLAALVADDPARLRGLVEAARPGNRTTEGPIGSHNWTTDPFATGAFTTPLPQAEAIAKIWRSPVAERIHFAGESTLAGPTSPFLERAYASGLAASTQIQRLTQGASA